MGCAALFLGLMFRKKTCTSTFGMEWLVICDNLECWVHASSPCGLGLLWPFLPVVNEGGHADDASCPGFTVQIFTVQILLVLGSGAA